MVERGAIGPDEDGRYRLVLSQAIFTSDHEGGEEIREFNDVSHN